MSQLADIYIELQKSLFDNMGSLDQPGADHVGSFARESLTQYFDCHMHLMGPFSSPREYLLASIQLTLDLIMREECYSHRAFVAFFNPSLSPRLCFDDFIMPWP